MTKNKIIIDGFVCGMCVSVCFMKVDDKIRPVSQVEKSHSGVEKWCVEGGGERVGIREAFVEAMKSSGFC